MKKCPHCGSQMTDESKYCSECGKEYAHGNVCPHCGVSVNDSDTFCYNCGKSLNKVQSSESFVYEKEVSKSRFKKYLPYIIGGVIILGIIGYCSSNDSKNNMNSGSNVTDSVANSSTKEVIKKRLEEIFEDVAKGNAKDCDERYFSLEFKQIYKMVEDIDSRYAEDGFIGFWDFTFWEKSQEDTHMKIIVDDVSDISTNEATAKLILKYTTDGVTSTDKENVKVVFENGKWVLDDWHGYKKEMKKFYEENKNYQPSSNQTNTDWLQGHWVYEQGNYKGHFVIQGNTLTMYSSMNPEHLTYTYRVEGNELFAGEMTVKLDFVNQRIDYGDGNWMYKTSSDSNAYSSSSSNSSSQSRTFANEQYVTMYLANQKFTNSSGVDIRIDGSLRMYIDGDYAGVVSVLRYNATSAMLRFGGGAYGEGKIGVRIVGDNLQLNDPVDGTVWYQK